MISDSLSIDSYAKINPYVSPAYRWISVPTNIEMHIPMNKICEKHDFSNILRFCVNKCLTSPVSMRKSSARILFRCWKRVKNRSATTITANTSIMEVALRTPAGPKYE